MYLTNNGHLMKVSFYGAFVLNFEWNMRVTQKHKADKGHLYEQESIFLMPHKHITLCLIYHTY